MFTVVRKYEVDESALFDKSLPEWGSKLSLLYTPQTYHEVAEVVVGEYIGGNELFAFMIKEI